MFRVKINRFILSNGSSIIHLTRATTLLPFFVIDEILPKSMKPLFQFHLRKRFLSCHVKSRWPKTQNCCMGSTPPNLQPTAGVTPRNRGRNKANHGSCSERLLSVIICQPQTLASNFNSVHLQENWKPQLSSFILLLWFSVTSYTEDSLIRGTLQTRYHQLPGGRFRGYG